MSCNAFQGTCVRDTGSDIDNADRKWSGFQSTLSRLRHWESFCGKHAHDQSRRRRLQTSPAYFFCLRSTRERLWICRGYKYTKFSVTLVKERDVKRKYEEKKAVGNFCYIIIIILVLCFQRFKHLSDLPFFLSI